MNKFFGNTGPVIHPVLISDSACLGPYPKILVICNMQTMICKTMTKVPVSYQSHTAIRKKI